MTSCRAEILLQRPFLLQCVDTLSTCLSVHFHIPVLSRKVCGVHRMVRDAHCPINFLPRTQFSGIRLPRSEAVIVKAKPRGYECSAEKEAPSNEDGARECETENKEELLHSSTILLGHQTHISKEHLCHMNKHAEN